MCQCPERGDLHFYLHTTRKGYEASSCVNALKGATFISTDGDFTDYDRLEYVCQYPERGDLHFYIRRQRQK